MTLAPTRWSQARAAAWAAERPWICGCNFLPSNAVNFLEMWRAETFDPETIARELAWGAEAGLNAARVNLPFVVWRHDGVGLLARVETFLAIAAPLGIDGILCLFDDCGFGGAEPVCGPQPDPIPGVHNSRAVASPGRAAVMERGLWPAFESYVKAVVGRFAQDPRVLFWDLYNEPTNRMVFTAEGAREHDPTMDPHSAALMRDAFAWARACEPRQPLTVGPWKCGGPGDPIEQAFETQVEQDALALSDIVTFHAYTTSQRMTALIDKLAIHGRPMVCTEWMARAVGSRIEEQAALLCARGVGAIHWGLVQGRTQTWLPWPSEIVRAAGGDPETSLWFHDLFKPDGAPYDAKEVETLRRLTSEDHKHLQSACRN